MLPELRPVHRDVGAPQQPGAVGRVGGREGDADARADARSSRAITKGSSSSSAIRSATSVASAASASTRTTRELVAAEPDDDPSWRGAAFMSRGPSWRSSSSPAGWPKESLISLKWLRSMKRNASRALGVRVVDRSAKNASSTWKRWRRLPSPVSSSVIAWRWRSSVRTRRSRAESASRMPDDHERRRREARGRPSGSRVAWVPDDQEREHAGRGDAGQDEARGPRLAQRIERAGPEPDRHRHEHDRRSATRSR